MTDAFVPPPAPTAQGSGAWAPQPVRPTGGTSAWAVVALVTGLLGIFFVALPAGVVGLVQTRRHQQGGWGMALAGVILGGALTAVLVLFVPLGLLGVFDEPLGDLDDVPTASIGQCLRHDGGWEVTDCSADHDAEIYLVHPASGTVWPGSKDLYDEADDLCYDAFEGYTGESYETSDDEYDFFLPTRQQWEQGRRDVVCAITPFF